MSERWHMNRIGFVNFWLYDEETFSFADGKLLLRGQNGSGKSITTQSFLPFILDGDRTPSRLDPFGSSDRRMEYYFLGDGEKEEATGYLFLEFRKGNRYRTIGIGQQAKRGKPMSFWGFILLDGRRIGHDLRLYREAGSVKIACTKQELKKLLGEENPFTEAQKEYMALVNKYIFGFPRLELYEQFIRLLIKVRAPKLSKEFKPTKVYEILNDSLQTLSDEDLRAMVDAMEKMDDIQERLDGYRRSARDLQIIGNEYTKYNRYMLAQKALAYLEERRQADAAREQLEEGRRELEESGRLLEEAKARSGELLEERRLLEGEREAIGVTGLEEADEKLRQCRGRIETAAQEIAGYEKRIEAHRETMREYDADLREIRRRADTCRSQIDQCVSYMEELQEDVRFPGHEELVSFREIMADEERVRELKRELEALCRRTAEAAVCLERLKETEEKWERTSEAFALRAKEKDRAGVQLHEAELLEDRERDVLIEAYYHLGQKNQEFYLDAETLGRLAVLIGRYQDGTDFEPVRRLTQAALTEKKKLLEKALSGTRLEQSKKEERLRSCEKELEAFEKTEEMEPPRRQMAGETRKRLREAGIPFLPFYEAVDFAEGVSQEERDLLECQLSDAGLLDALVVSQKDRDRAVRILGEWSDRLLQVEDFRTKPFQKDGLPAGAFEGEGTGEGPLLAAVAEDPGLLERTRELLSCIGSGEGFPIVLRADGYFRHGALEGYSKPETEACYIGEAVRREKKQALIRQKQEELAGLQTELAAMRQEIGRLTERGRLLDQEYEELPAFGNLEQAVTLREKCARSLGEAEASLRKAEEEKELCGEEKKRQEQRVIACCGDLPYERSVPAYREVRKQLGDYKEQTETLQAALMHLTVERNKEEAKEQLFEKEEEAVDREDFQKRRVEREKKEQSVQAERLEEFLASPENREKARRLGEIREALRKNQEEGNELGKKQAVWESNVKRLEPELEGRRILAAEKTERESRLRGYFEEELELGLVFPGEGLGAAEAAKKAGELLGETERNRSVTDVVSNLDRIFHGHSGSLVTYGTFMEECFGGDTGEASVLRKRHRIVSYEQGKRVYFEEFCRRIREKTEETELLIRQKDRELFENILSDTLSRKLNARIAESRRWIQDMSALMRKLDTSMSLSFSLDWRAKTAEGEGELNTAELEKLLNRDKELMTAEDIGRLSSHFRNRIYTVKQTAEENGDVVSYADLVREALDYRKWFEFRMYYYRNDENRKELTNGAFNRFSGGEKAMAMYVPLFAAVNAQYKKAERDDLPRMIALDEAFAGVDDKNIGSMFELVRKFDFDYIMNSQVLWGCYASIPALRIAELLRPANSQVVTVIYYLWNGKQRIIEEQ